MSSWPKASLGTTRIPVWPLQSTQDLGVYCYKYTSWCNGARELYDLWTDPFETVNRWLGVRFGGAGLASVTVQVGGGTGGRWVCVRWQHAEELYSCVQLLCVKASL